MTTEETDLLRQCPACGFVGTLDDFDLLPGEESDLFEEFPAAPYDELMCNVCDTAMRPEELAVYDPREVRRRRWMIRELS
jgi:hypothetical protein